MGQDKEVRDKVQMDESKQQEKENKQPKKGSEQQGKENLQQEKKSELNEKNEHHNAYYQPKTDQSQSVLLNRIESYNKQLKYQAFGQKYLLNPAGKILKTPSKQIVQVLDSEKDEEAAEVSKVFRYAKAAGTLLEKRADKAQIKTIYQDMALMERYLKAGTIFTKDSFTETGSIFQDIEDLPIIHPEKVTRGDLAMFRYRLKHSDTAMEELLTIRKETNARYENGGKIDYQKFGRRNGVRKQVDQLVQLSEIRAFLAFSRNLAKEDHDFFTLSQRAILYREESFFTAHHLADFTTNIALIQKIIKSPSLSVEFSHLDPDGLMNERTIRRLLHGQIPGFKLEKAGMVNGKGSISAKSSFIQSVHDRKPMVLDAKTYHLLRGGLSAILWNQRNYRKMLEKQRALSGRESIKGWVLQEFKQEMMEDEEFSAMSAYMDHAVPFAGAGVKAAVGTGRTAGEAAGRFAMKSGTAAENALITDLHKMGNDVAAEAVRALGEEISGTLKEVNGQITYAMQLPKRAARSAEKKVISAAASGVRKLGSQVGMWEKSLAATKVGTVVIQSHAYQGMKAVGRKAVYGMRRAGHLVHKTTDAIFGSAGVMTDSFRNWIVKPAVMVIGLIVLLQIALAAVLGGMGGNSVVSVMVFDTPEHFNHPSYTTPEEMGFQQRYEQAQSRFQAQIDGVINGYAKTLNKKGQQIPYGVNGTSNQEGNQNGDYVSGVTMHFDIKKSNNLEDILSCIAVVMQQQQAEHHAEALELLDCFYQSSHTYDYIESPLYSCNSGCETTKYFCNEGKEGYLSSEMKFAPYLCGELSVPKENQTCEVDRKNSEKNFSEYAGCAVIGTCYHNAGDEEDNFGRGKPQRNTCSNPEAYWDCAHSCTSSDCRHDCSRSTLGCGGYWYCGGHDHYGCPDGHEVKTCFGHVNIEMNIQMKSLEEMFALGGVEAKEKKVK